MSVDFCWLQSHNGCLHRVGFLWSGKKLPLAAEMTMCAIWYLICHLLYIWRAHHNHPILHNIVIPMHKHMKPFFIYNYVMRSISSSKRILFSDWHFVPWCSFIWVKQSKKRNDCLVFHQLENNYVLFVLLSAYFFSNYDRKQ